MRQLYNKHSKTIELIVIIVSSLLAIVSLIFSIITYINTKDEVEQYQQVIDNLRQPYIIEFKQSYKECISPYFPLFNIPWDGTSIGCNCSQSTDLDDGNKMHKGGCSAEYNDCRYQPGITKGNFFYFLEDDKKYEQTICGKRASNDNQFHKIAGKQTGTCSSSQKTCGNPNIPETVFCVDQSDSCPVYSFQIYSTVQAQFNEPDWGYIKINQNQHFYYDKKGTSAKALPLSQITSTSGKGPCEFYVYKQTAYDSEYLLMNWSRPTCDTDTEFIQTDINVSEDNFYKLNLMQADYDVVSKWPGFDLKNSKEIYRTYYKPYIPWRISDRNQLEELVSVILSIDTLVDIMKYAIIATAASVVVIAIYLNCHYLYYILIAKISYESDKITEFKRIKLIVSFIFKIVSMIIAIVAFRTSGQYQTVLEEVVNTKPTLDVYVGQFKVLSDFTSIQIHRNNLITIITTIINMIIDIVSAVMEIIKYRKQKIQQNQVQDIKLDEETENMQKNTNYHDNKKRENNHNNEQTPSYQQEQYNRNKFEKNSNQANASPQFNVIKKPLKSSPNLQANASPNTLPQSNFNKKHNNPTKEGQQSQTQLIVLNDKGLVFENGMVKTKKEISRNKL